MAQRWLWLAALLAWITVEAPAREYALLLEEPALVEQMQFSRQARTAAGANRLARIDSLQARVAGQLAARNVRITGSARRLVNALFVQATPEEAAAFRSLPGVTAVTEVPKVKHHMDRAAELVRAPAAWEWAGGFDRAGSGVKIAILDSGIDLNHAGFQDDSLALPQGFPKGRREHLSYTNKKVIAARVYTREDDDGTPRDLNGYGTATAMIAAGGRVTAPIGSISGIAPKAWIGNYKIFDWNGNTYASDLIRALEDAYDDGMDIAVIPFGTLPEYPPFVRLSDCAGGRLGFGVPADACDVLATAAENAAKAGMTVVVSAGNDGDSGSYFPTYNTINTPGTAPSAITVGASYNSYNKVSVAGDDAPEELRRIDGLFGDGPRPADVLTAGMAAVESLACSALPDGSLSGRIALIERGECDFVDKVRNAARAGASAVMIYQDGDRFYPFNIVGLAETPIPAVMIGATSGAALKAYLGDHPDAQLSVDPRAVPAEGAFDEVAEPSSRGPSIDGAAIKPELVAPAYDLYTATQKFDEEGDLFNPAGYTYVSGTSYAAALTAGAAALVKQQRPEFDPERIKSALVNTAADIRDETGRPSVIASGAGKLDISAAVRTTVTVAPATLSFGVLGSGSLPASLALRVVNSGDGAVALRLSTSGTRDNAAAVRLSQSTLDLEPGKDATLSVQLAGERPEPGVYDGYVLIEGGQVPLRVPYLYLVSDGAPDTYFYLFGNGYNGAPNEQDIKLEFRVTDRYGVALPDLNVVFRVTRGNGRISYADAQTDVVGKAAAVVSLGSATGEYEFTAEIPGFETIPFRLTAGQ